MFVWCWFDINVKALSLFMLFKRATVCHDKTNTQEIQITRKYVKCAKISMSQYVSKVR